MEFRFEHTPLIKKVSRLAKKYGVFGLYDWNSDICYIFNNPYPNEIYEKPHNFYTTLYVIKHEELHAVVYKVAGRKTCKKLDNVIQNIIGGICPRMFDWEE